jgi:succinate dehydrogenase/fumarate reductase flavoprotein subunit
MVVAAAQERKESRRYGWIGGVHLRSDYPKRDDENWLKYVLIEKDQVTGRPVLSVSATLRSDSREDRHD